MPPQSVREEMLHTAAGIELGQEQDGQGLPRTAADTVLEWQQQEQAGQVQPRSAAGSVLEQAMEQDQEQD